MKVNVTQVEKNRICMEVEVPQEEVIKEKKTVFDYLKVNAKVPGFRQGRIPEDVLKKNYEGKVRHEVIDNLLPKAFQDALKEKNLTPLTSPQFSDVKLEGDGPLTFKATFETRPQIELGQYKKIKLEKKEVEVTNEEIEKKLTELQTQASTLEEIKDRQEVAVGDYAVVDFKGAIDGKPVQGLSRQNYMVLVSEKENMIDPVAQAIIKNVIGMKRGERKNVETVMAKENMPVSLAGKTIALDFTLKDMRKRILPEINDGFAAIFGFKDMVELKLKLKEEMHLAKENAEKRRLVDEMVDKLVADTKIELSSTIIKRQRDFLVYKFTNELASRKIALETYLQANNLTKEALDEQYMKAAEHQLKAKLIFHEISQKENIKVEEADLNTEIEKIALEAKKTVEEVKTYLEKKDMMDNLAEDIIERKIVEFLFTEAEIKEKGKIWEGFKKIFGKKQ